MCEAYLNFEVNKSEFLMNYVLQTAFASKFSALDFQIFCPFWYLWQISLFLINFEMLLLLAANEAVFN